MIANIMAGLIIVASLVLYFAFLLRIGFITVTRKP